MNLKRFKKGSDRNSDQLLKWIEEGCFDALKRKYLKSAILTVLADTTSPNNVLETYTLRVNYPDSALHQAIDAATANIAQLSLTRNDQSVFAVESSPANFKDAISKILRSLCVMSQTLKSLPGKKCLSMKLTYYEEVTPMGYEPPGFVAAEFDIDHLFVQGATSKYAFGKATTPYHNIGLSMETMFDDNVRPNKANATINSQALVFPQSQPTAATTATAAVERQVESNTINVQDGIDFNESVMIASQVAQPANSAPKFPTSPNPTHTTVKEKDKTDQDTKPVKVPLSEMSHTQQQVQIIKCTCGHQVKDLEMLQCDSCTNWQHSVCAGYVSCRDRRLEGHLYFCYYCQYGSQQNTFNFIRNLSLKRKALAVISAEGFETVKGFCERLGVSNYFGTKIRDQLVEENFMKKVNQKYEISKKNDYIKEKIKFYFNQNLTIHPEFVEAQAIDNQKHQATKRKTPEDEKEMKTKTVTKDFPSEIGVVKDVSSEIGVAKDVPIEIGNTVPFAVPCAFPCEAPCDVTDTPKHVTDPETGVKNSTVLKTIAPVNNSVNPSKTVNVSTSVQSGPLPIKKKRKISIPSSRISCYMNTEPL